MKLIKHVVLGCSALLCCGETPKVPNPEFEWIGLEVTASAYNSVAWQTTEEQPNTAAWGDTLKPGMKSIAVSRDLLQIGLRHNTMVMIDTFPDTFYVKDKMNRRWKRRIDIYMGENVKAARQWGKKKLFICYAVPFDSITNVNE